MVVLFSKCDSQMILQSVSLDTGYWAWLVRISPNVCSRCREDSAQTPRGIRWGLIEEEFKSTCFGGEIYASCPQPTEAEERCESKMETDFTAEAMLNEVVQRRGTESSAWQRNLRREKWRCFAEVKIISMKKSYVPVFFSLYFFGIRDCKNCHITWSLTRPPPAERPPWPSPPLLLLSYAPPLFANFFLHLLPWSKCSRHTPFSFT